MSANERQAGGEHYKRMGVQPWDVIDTWPINERIACYRAGALKYLMRLNDKDTPLLNAQKAGHYVEKLVEVLATDDSVMSVTCPATLGDCTDGCGEWCKQAVGERTL